METIQSSIKGTDNFIDLWKDLTSDLWQETFKSFDFSVPAVSPVEMPWHDYQKHKKNKTFKFMKTAFQNLTTIHTLFAHPQEPASYFKDIGSTFEFSNHMALDFFENMIEFQTQWLKSVSRIGEQTQAYRFDDIDPGIFESFRKLYLQEFQKYFLIPQLGLPRYSQEKINKSADKFNLFCSYLMELIYLFGIAIDKSNRVMQENLGDMILKGDIFENPEKGYDQWIKTLEGHFMILLKSEDFLNTLNNTIASYTEYKQAREEVLCLILKTLPIPSNNEMDAVYKDLYEIKKKINAISKKIMAEA